MTSIRILYWITIGWLIWLLKWIFSKIQVILDKTSIKLHHRLIFLGYNYTLKKVSRWITVGFVVIVLSLCGLSGIFSEDNSQNDEPVFTQLPTFPPTITVTLTPSQTATNTQVPSTSTSTKIPPTKTYTQIPSTSTPIFNAKYEARCVAVDSEIQTAIITRVIDGNTIVVEINGKEFHLRYIGVDSPETDEKFGDISKMINEDLVLGQTVILAKDVSEVDSFGRLLRYVFIGDIFVNYQLILKGAAHAGTWNPDTACDLVFKGAENAAIASGIGIWKTTPTSIVVFVPTYTPVSIQSGIVPVPIPAIAQPTSAPVGNCDPSYPTVCIPPAPPDLDCGEITYRRFQVLQPDPHRFDGDKDGIGCESG